MQTLSVLFNTSIVITPDENIQLKEQIEAMAVSATLLEQKHKEQMSEALENMETVQRAHKQEVTEIQANMKQQSENKDTVEPLKAGHH